MIAALRSFITAHHMIRSGAPVVVAVSGGPDSLCLLHGLSALQKELAIDLHVAHLDHMIRGNQSAAEAQFVANLARQWNLPATIEAIDVPALAHRTHANLHAAARRARYTFLARVAIETQAQAVAVAHHAGDQAETVLLHLLRGAGPAGLGGMQPVVRWEGWADNKHNILPTEQLPRLIRPLLHITRAEIDHYCSVHQLNPRYDPSNFDLNATRNRIRHDLLLRLAEEYNPQIIAALGRSATLIADEHAFIVAALDTAWSRLVRQRTGAFDFDGRAWKDLHPAMQRAALRRAYTQLLPSTLSDAATLDLEHVERARALIERGVGRVLDLPCGITLTVGYDGAFTLGEPALLDGPQLEIDTQISLPHDGHILIGNGWSLEITPIPTPTTPQKRGFTIDLDARLLPETLTLRHRRPGDQIRLPNGNSHRKLQDIFVDAKVPRALRANWPILALSDTIIWVAGLRIDHTFLATPHSRTVIQIRLIRHTKMEKP